MTPTDLPAGPELDCLIAEKAMGWRPYTAIGTFLDESRGIHNTHPSAHGGLAFHPSTKIAHAWQVVEHMTQTTKESWEFTHTTTLQIAVFEFEGGRERPWKPGQYVGQSLSMPHAICLAALAAIATKDQP